MPRHQQVFFAIAAVDYGVCGAAQVAHLVVLSLQRLQGASTKVETVIMMQAAVRFH